MLTGLVLAATMAAALLWTRRDSATIEPVTFTFGPPENATLASWPGVPSPDGRRIAFVADEASGKTALWTRALDSKAAQRIAGTEDASGPFWSPDGQFIGFFAQGKLKKIAVSGGPSQSLCNITTDLGASWSASGDIVFAPINRNVLHRVAAGGGTPQPITTLDAARQENSHRWPHFLPDGRHFLFTARSSVKENTAIYVGSLDSKETKRLLTAPSNAQYAPPGYLLFAREGTLMGQRFDASKLELRGDAFPVAGAIEHVTPSASAMFSVSRDGTVLSYQEPTRAMSQLAWFDRKGASLGAVGSQGEFVQPRLSPDGKRVAAVRPDPESGNRDIWLMEVGSGALTRFTFNPANDWYPVWSPNGKEIAFTSDRNPTSGIYRKAVNGSGAEELLLPASSNREAWLSDWSSDNRFLAYQSDAGNALNDIWILPLFGDRKPYRFVATEFMEHSAKFSPNGKWVAYVSNESGTEEIYARPLGSPGKVRISTSGGTQPAWRRDGKELFYVAPGRILMAVDVTGGKRSRRAHEGNSSELATRVRRYGGLRRFTMLR